MVNKEPITYEVITKMHYHKVKGEVKLQRKKSEIARVRIKAFLGSRRSLLELRMTVNKIRLRTEPMMTIGKYRPRSR